MQYKNVMQFIIRQVRSFTNNDLNNSAININPTKKNILQSHKLF
jgi:hypothetical protein